MCSLYSELQYLKFDVILVDLNFFLYETLPIVR
jgi:hypothetical protein